MPNMYQIFFLNFYIANLLTAKNTTFHGVMISPVLPLPFMSLIKHGPLLLDRLVNQNPFCHGRYVAYIFWDAESSRGGFLDQDFL